MGGGRQGGGKGTFLVSNSIDSFHLRRGMREYSKANIYSFRTGGGRRGGGLWGGGGEGLGNRDAGPNC